MILQPHHFSAEAQLVPVVNQGYIFADGFIAAIKVAIVIGVNRKIVVHDHRQLGGLSLRNVHACVGQPERRTGKGTAGLQFPAEPRVEQQCW